MDDPKQTQPTPPKGVSLKTALANLGIPDDAEVPLDKLEDELIKQTKLAKEVGFDRAKLFFKSMTNQESGGKEGVVSPDSARGRWQVTDNLAKDYNLDNTDPVLNRYMGIDYWDKGYQAADKLDPNPLERAAAATAWYHGGPKALEHVYKTGEYPTIRDNKGLGISTSDHVRTVMDNWLAQLKANGLDKDIFPQPTTTPTGEEPWVEKIDKTEGTPLGMLDELERVSPGSDSPQVRGPKEFDSNKSVPSTKPWEKFKTLWVMPDDQSRVPTGPELDNLYKRTLPVNDRWTFDATREIYNSLGVDLTFARHTEEEINSTARTYQGSNGQRMYAIPLAIRQQALDVMEKVRTEGVEAAKAYAAKLADDNDRQQYSTQVIEQQQKDELEKRAKQKGDFKPLSAALDALNPWFGIKRALTGTGIDLPVGEKMSATIRSSEERISALIDSIDAGLAGIAGTVAGTVGKNVADKLVTPFFGSALSDRLSRNDAELMEKYQLTKQQSQYLVEATNKAFKDSGAADYYWTKIQPKTLVPNLAALDWAARKVTGKRILPEFMYGEKIPINPYEIIRETSVGTVQLGMMLPAMQALGPVGGAYYFSLYKSLAEGKSIGEAGGDALLNAATMELIGSPLVHKLPGLLRPVAVAGIFGGESTALDYRQRLDAWRSLPIDERSKIPAPQVDWNIMYSGLVAGILMNGMELFPKGTDKLTSLDLYYRPKIGEYTNSAYRVAQLNAAHDNPYILPPIPAAIKTQQLAAIEVAERLSQALDPSMLEKKDVGVNQSSISSALQYVKEAMDTYLGATSKHFNPLDNTQSAITKRLSGAFTLASDTLSKALDAVNHPDFKGTMAEMKSIKADLDIAMNEFHEAINDAQKEFTFKDLLNPDLRDALGSKTVAQVVLTPPTTPVVEPTETVRTVEQQAAVESAARNHQPTTHALVNIVEARDADDQPTHNAIFIDNNGDPVHVEVTSEQAKSLRDYKDGVDKLVADGIAKGESHETLEPKIREAMRKGPVTDEAIAGLRAEEHILQIDRAFRQQAEEALMEAELAKTATEITPENKDSIVNDTLNDWEKRWIENEALEKTRASEIAPLEQEQASLIKQLFIGAKGMVARKAQMLEIVKAKADQLAEVDSHEQYLKALKAFNITLAKAKLFDVSLSKIELDILNAKKEGTTEEAVKARNEQYLADIEKAKLDLGKAAEVTRLKAERTTAYQEGMAQVEVTSTRIAELTAKQKELMGQFAEFINGEVDKILGDALKKSPTEPKFVTDQRVKWERFKQDQKGDKQVRNAGPALDRKNVEAYVAFTISTGYDLYRAGLEYGEWIAKMVEQTPEYMHQFLADTWAKVRMLSETKVRNDRGPITVFHGTEKEFKEFSIAKAGAATDLGWYAVGAYFGKDQLANKYAGELGNVHRVYLNITNPLHWDYGKDSSIPDFIDDFKRMEDGKFEHRSPNGWRLPEPIHDQAVRDVKDYLERTKPIESDYKTSLRAAIEKRDKFKDNWTASSAKANESYFLYDSSRTVEAFYKYRELQDAADVDLMLYETATLELNKIQDTEFNSKITFKDRQQIHRMITTIMKEKGFDGVFVVKDSDTPLERVHEYVAFHPDQILSAYEGFTPRDLEGRPLDPAKIVKEGKLKFSSERARQINASQEGFGFNPIDWGITIYEGYKKIRDFKRDNTYSRAMWDLVNYKGRTLAAYSERAINHVLDTTQSYSKTGQMLKEFSNKSAVLLKDAKVSLFDYYKSIQQSRLDGIRDAYTDIANKAMTLDPDKLIIAFARKGSIDWAGQLDEIVKTAKAKGSQYPWADTKDIISQLQTASENFKNTSDPTSYDAVRTIIRNNFIYAAASVSDVMPRAEYDRIVNHPSIKSADLIYKDLIHVPLRTAFIATDATPTDRLGARGLYFPLIPKESATGQPVSIARTIMDRAPLEAPSSPAARYATGLGEYTTNIADIRKSFYSQIRAGDIAGMITALESLGIITRVKKDPLTGIYAKPREGYIHIDASPKRQLTTIKEIGDIRVNDTISLPKVKYEVNKAIYEDFRRLIEPDRYPRGEGIIQKAADAMLHFYIAGPLDLIVHSMNVLYAAQSAIGITPVDYFTSKLTKPLNHLFTGIGYIPIVGLPQLVSDAVGIPAFARPVTDAFISMLEPRMIYTAFKVLENKIDSKDPAKQAEAFEYLQLAIGSGTLPSHTGSETWSPTTANATGAALMGPLQYKPVRTLLSKMSGKDIPDPTNIVQLASNGFKDKAIAELKRLGRVIKTSPFLFGWNGIDVRARMAVLKAIESYAPNMPEYEKFRVLSTLGVYNRYMESSLGQFLKSYHISPFYSAANAGLRRGLNAFTISGSDPVKRLIRYSDNGAMSKSSLYAVSALSNSITTYVTTWALMSHQITGLWPWEDEKSRIGKIRIPKAKIQEFIDAHQGTWVGDKANWLQGAMGVNPSPDADFYVTVNPLASSVRGLRATGMESFANTYLMNLGARKDPDNPNWLLDAITDRKLFGLAANRASAQFLTNSVLHTTASGWAPHAAMAAAGWLPAVTYKVDASNARNSGLAPLSYENPAKQSMNIDAIVARRTAAMFFSLNSLASAIGGAAEWNPEELGTYDNPWDADLFKWIVGLLTRNAVIQQNTPVQNNLLRKGLHKMASETKEKKPGSLGHVPEEEEDK